MVFLLKGRDKDLGSDVASFWSFDYFVKRRDKDLGFDVISFRSLVSLFKQRDKDLVSAAWLSLQRLKTSFQSAKIGFQSAKACFQNAKIGFWNSAAATRGLDSSFDTRHGILLNSATGGNKQKRVGLFEASPGHGAWGGTRARAGEHNCITRDFCEREAERKPAESKIIIMSAHANLNFHQVV